MSFDGRFRPSLSPGKVRSYPDEDEGNVAVNFWFRNVTYFAEEEEGLDAGVASFSEHRSEL